MIPCPNSLLNSASLLADPRLRNRSWEHLVFDDIVSLVFLGPIHHLDGTAGTSSLASVASLEDFVIASRLPVRFFRRSSPKSSP